MSKRNKLIIMLRKSPILKIIPVLLRLVAKSCGDFSIYLFINKYVAIVTKVAVIFARKKTICLFSGSIGQNESNHLSHDR